MFNEDNNVNKEKGQSVAAALSFIDKHTPFKNFCQSDVPLTVADSRNQNPIKQMLGSGVHFHPRPWFPCGRLHRRVIALIDDHKDTLDNKPLNRLSGDVWQTMLSVSTRKGGGTSTQRNALLSQQVV